MKNPRGSSSSLAFIRRSDYEIFSGRRDNAAVAEGNGPPTQDCQQFRSRRIPALISSVPDRASRVSVPRAMPASFANPLTETGKHSRRNQLPRRDLHRR
jgi:hypothetical protein